MDTFKKVYLIWKGRISRKTFWIYSIPLSLLCIPSLFPGSASHRFHWSDILALIAAYPAVMVNIKRAHDRNRSGWFTLLLLVPVVAMWPFIELGFVKGSDGANKYGEPDGIWNK